MRHLWQEFRDFAFKGNMIELAVGVVIGTAFGKVITSIVANVIMPIISYVTPKTAFTDWHIGKVLVGPLLNDLLAFVLTAIAVFIVIVKLMGSIMRRASPPAPAAPVTKECEHCLSVIPVKARKCGHCTTDLAAVAS